MSVRLILYTDRCQKSYAVVCLLRIGLKLVAKSSSSTPKSYPEPNVSHRETVQNIMLKLQQSQQALPKNPQDDQSEAHLDSIDLFNPPKSNPNGRLASSKLFHKNISPKLALSSKQFRENQEKYLNSWRISAICIILFVNSVSALLILQDKFQTAGVTSESATTPKILAGKPNLAAQEFITPDLNSLSHISITPKPKKQLEASLPLSIPPTNLPSQEIISPRAANIPYYYILVEYTGEASLHLARKQVKNASLVNFPQGIFIYLGAFSEKPLAQNFVNSVKEEGLDAYIYPDVN